MDRKKPVLKKNAGMTLLEVVVAAAILSVIMVAIFEMLSRQGKIAAEELNEIDTQTNLRRAFTEVVFELSDARIYAVSDDGLTVTYGKPRTFNGIPVLNANGTVSFGAMSGVGFVADAPGTQSARMTLAFVDKPETIIAEDSKTGDLNNDGDLNDQYVFGDFVHTTNVVGSINYTETRTVNYNMVREFPNGPVFLVRQPFGTGIHRAENYKDVNTNNVYDKGIDVFTPADDLNSNGIFDGPDSDGFVENTVTKNNIYDGNEGAQSSNLDPITGNPIVNVSLRVRLMDLDLRKRENETLSNASRLLIAETAIRLRNQAKK